MKVTVTGGTISPQEQAAYVDRAMQKYPHNTIEELGIHIDGDFVDLEYTLQPQKFSRIRRITGYLVGTLERFNNAKRAEEHDRVKHGVTQ